MNIPSKINKSKLYIFEDNRAKEIILLSTAFATMLLSTCFLFFIVWFCCYTMMKERRFIRQARKLRKSILESESNLNKVGITTHLFSSDTGTGKSQNARGKILVRDDVEHDIGPTLINQTEKTLPTDKSKIKSVIIRHQPLRDKKSTNGHFVAYHPYDSLRNVSSLSKQALIKELKKNKLFDKNAQIGGQLNPAFINDYEHYNEATPCKNNCGSLNRCQITRDKVLTATNSSLKGQSKLTRKQIEREYFEYDLELQKQLRKFSTTNSSSSLTPITTTNNNSSNENSSANLKTTTTIKKQDTSTKMAKKLPVKVLGSALEKKKSDQIWQI